MAINLFSKIKNLMARGVVTLLEGQGYQVTLYNGETRSNLEHLQEFGLASVKPNGINGKGICCFYGGNRSNGSLLVMEFPDIKPELASGESAIFNAFEGLVKLGQGEIVMKSPVVIEDGATGVITGTSVAVVINGIVTEIT